jgi:hypothetical protein
VFFVKIQGSGDFLEIMNYFPIEKGVEKVHGEVDRVHVTGPWVRGLFIKRQPSNRRWTAQI